MNWHPLKPALAAGLALAASVAVAEPSAEDIAAGKAIAGDRNAGNCFACHQVEGAELAGNIGPPLLAIVLSGVYNHIWGRRLEKQRLLQIACVCGVINLAWLTPLKLLGWLPDNQSLVFAIVFVQYALYVCFTILRTIANHSLLADVADEQELHSGERQEGVMFAAAFFSAKFITGFGYLVGGPFLDLIGLEAGAQPGTTPASVELGIGLVMGPGLALLMLVPVWMAFSLRLSRAGTEGVQQALAAKRAGAAGGN